MCLPVTSESVNDYKFEMLLYVLPTLRLHLHRPVRCPLEEQNHPKAENASEEMKVEYTSLKVSVRAKKVYRVSYHLFEAIHNILRCHLRVQAPIGRLLFAIDIIAPLLHLRKEAVSNPLTSNLMKINYLQTGGIAETH